MWNICAMTHRRKRRLLGTVPCAMMQPNIGSLSSRMVSFPSLLEATYSPPPAPLHGEQAAHVHTGASERLDTLARPFGKSGRGIMTGHRRIDRAQTRILADNDARGGKFLVRDGEFRAASGAQDFCFLFLSAHCEFVNS
ncbi:hypothetical protein NIB75_06480 [Bacteroides uniformis]|nr:hypothetical protein [Bacteroides uniformis]